MAELLAHWKLDGNFKDVSGNGYDLTEVTSGGVFVEDADGNEASAWTPNYTANALLECTDEDFLNAFSGEVALSFWYYHIKGADQFSIGAYRSSRPYLGLFIYASSKYGFVINGTTKYSSEVLPIYEWMHIVINVTSSGSFLIINGEVKMSIPSVTSKWVGRFGIFNWLSTSNYLVDDIKAYGSSLTDDEIEEIIKEGVNFKEKVSKKSYRDRDRDTDMLIEGDK